MNDSIPLRIIVLQPDLQLDGFGEVTFLLLASSKKVLDVLSNVGDRYFTRVVVSHNLQIKGDGG